MRPPTHGVSAARIWISETDLRSPQAFANVSTEGRSEISRSDSGGSGPAGDLANGPRISLSRAAPIYLSRFATQPADTAGFEIEKARLQHRLSAPRGCKLLPI